MWSPKPARNSKYKLVLKHDHRFWNCDSTYIKYYCKSQSGLLPGTGVTNLQVCLGLRGFLRGWTFTAKTRTVPGKLERLVIPPGTQVFAEWKINMIPPNLWHFSNEKQWETETLQQSPVVIYLIFLSFDSQKSAFPWTNSSMFSTFPIYSFKFFRFRCLCATTSRWHHDLYLHPGLSFWIIKDSYIQLSPWHLYLNI